MKHTYFLLLFLALLLLSGCDKEHVIKMKGAKNIWCEGLEKTTGLNVVVTIGKNTIIQYTSRDGESLIIAKKCLIE